ncbi:OTU4 [Symbiodinium pilosum]|uniref:ubiquitinyl hydrolase 1 n=1 Tax=Symbiodinium pilosum TaxID=2952 RepID=A0A812JRI3_SYMPI|nr:OTU4 [Symbiodinium pilosum]
MTDRSLRLLRNTLEALMNFPREKYIADPNAFTRRINDAANLLCCEDCVPGGAKVIDEMMSGVTKTPLDARALIFVVDLVLKRGLREQNRHPKATVMANLLRPFLSNWLRVLLMTRRAPEQLEKTKTMIQRWAHDGYLPMDGLLPLLELMDEPPGPISEDSQQSSQSLDFTQSQPSSDPPCQGRRDSSRDTKQLVPAQAQQPRQPAEKEPPLKRARVSEEVQRPVGQGQEPTRRLVLPSAQKEKKIPPRRSLSGSLEPAGSPANAKPTPKAQVAHMAEVGQVAQIAQVVQVAQVAPDPAKDGDQKAKDSSQKATAQAAPPAQDDSNARTPDKASQQEGKTANGTAAQEPFKWRVSGDCRCLFRAVIRSCLLDPYNQQPRDNLGEPVDVDQRTHERESADMLRRHLCKELQRRKDEVEPLLEHSEFEVYLKRMGEWQTWGDEICLKFLPDVVKQPLQVYSFNCEKQELFDAGLYLPTKKEYHGRECIVLLHNGRSHFDLVSKQWLQGYERRLLAQQ